MDVTLLVDHHWCITECLWWTQGIRTCSMCRREDRRFHNVLDLSKHNVVWHTVNPLMHEWFRNSKKVDFDYRCRHVG